MSFEPIWERERRRKEKEKLESVVAAHTPQIPASDAEASVLRNGERQLNGHVKNSLAVLDLLLTTDIYFINSRLRQRQSLDQAPNSMLDSNGYATKKAFVDDVRSMFGAMGSDLDLDVPATMYRGIGLQTGLGDDQFDFWGLRSFLRTGTPPAQNVLSDPGIAFASPVDSIAQCYEGVYPSVFEVEARVLLELVVHRGLCVPSPEHRSEGLLRLLYPHYFLRTARGQIVIPPDTKWEVTSTQPVGADGWARLALMQVV